MRTIFVIQVIRLCRNGRRKQLRYIKLHSMQSGNQNLYTADINLAQIYYTDSSAEQSCAWYCEMHPRHKFKVLAVNIVINQNYEIYA
jgi:hypothetical protein